MVKIEGPSDSDRFDAAVHRLAGGHGLAIDVEGWTRKTFDLYLVESRLGRRVKVARVDSFATTSGEVELFDDRGLPFAEALGRELEQSFGVKEARIRRR